MEEWTKEYHILHNLDDQALDHTLNSLSKTICSKVSCYRSSTKELGNKLIKLSLGIEGIRENKLSSVMQQFNSFEIISIKSFEQMETTFLKIMVDLFIFQNA